MESTERFSDRVANYVRWRPRYPESLFDALVTIAGLEPSDVVADLGSGTGISTGPLLERGLEVYAVEPNAAMRAAAEALHSESSGFHSIAAEAEATGLDEASVALALAAQAFHWFDRPRLRRELQRILRPDGWFAIVWNSRLTEATEFLRDFEELLQRWGTDYQAVDHTQIPSAEIRAFLPRDYSELVFSNEQRLDYSGLEGRLLSASYTPPAGHADHQPMLADLRRTFDQRNEDGFVRIVYETKLHIGRL